MEQGGEVRDVKMPDGIRRDQFLAWVEGLEDQVDNLMSCYHFFL